MDTRTATDDAESLRHGLVAEILEWHALSEAVAEAMRTLPRHIFVPNASMQEAYTDDVVVTRQDENGIATSSASGPWLVGRMLSQLQIAPGMNVLELGTGTGYNAGLLSLLVGPHGTVTSIEITPDVADEARRALETAGVSNVEVICGDGRDGHVPHALYDRIIATAGVWELPQAWAQQLKPGGIAVVPLRINGFTRSIALRLDNEGIWRGNDSKSRAGYTCATPPAH